MLILVVSLELESRLRATVKENSELLDIWERGLSQALGHSLLTGTACAEFPSAGATLCKNLSARDTKGERNGGESVLANTGALWLHFAQP